MIRYAPLLFLTLIFGVTSTLQASTIVAVTDPDSPGGVDNVTRDLRTGLEWLDWTASTLISYDSIVTQFGEGGQFEGWRHATRDEARELFVTLDLPVQNFPFSSFINDGGVSRDFALGLLGATLDTPELLGTSGVIADDPENTRFRLTAAVFRGATLDAPTVTDARALFLSNQASLNVGHALVRTAVPEPATASLLLAVVALLSRGHRRV